MLVASFKAALVLVSLSSSITLSSAFDINGSCDCKLNTSDCSADNKIYHCNNPAPNGKWSHFEDCPSDSTCETYVWAYSNYYTADPAKPDQQGAKCIPNKSTAWQAPAESCDPNTTCVFGKSAHHYFRG